MRDFEDRFRERKQLDANQDNTSKKALEDKHVEDLECYQHEHERLNEECYNLEKELALRIRIGIGDIDRHCTKSLKL